MQPRWFEREDAFSRLMNIVYSIERDLVEIRDYTERYLTELHSGYNGRVLKNSSGHLDRELAEFITCKEESVTDFLKRIEYTKSDSSIIAERLLSARELVKETRASLRKYGAALYGGKVPEVGLHSSLYDSADDKTFYHRAAFGIKDKYEEVGILMSLLNRLKKVFSENEFPEFHKIVLSSEELSVLKVVLGPDSDILSKRVKPTETIGYYFINNLLDVVPKDVTVKRVRNEILLIRPKKKIRGTSVIRDAAIKTMNLLESSDFNKKVNRCVISGDSVVYFEFPTPLSLEGGNSIKRFPIYSLQDLEDLRDWVLSRVSEELRRELPKMSTVDKMYNKLVQTFERYAKEDIFFTVSFYWRDITITAIKH